MPFHVHVDAFEESRLVDRMGRGRLLDCFNVCSNMDMKKTCLNLACRWVVKRSEVGTCGRGRFGQPRQTSLFFYSINL